MMKRYLLYIFFGLTALPTWGQGVTEYYRLPSRSAQSDRLLKRYGGPSIQNRWYVALDGFIRTDRAQLDNSFGGLIESNTVTKAGWAALIGWSHRERWTVEAGYARMPVHTQVSVVNASSPVNFRYTNAHNAFVLRAKRLVLSTSKPWLRSGLWLSGGMWAVPNAGEKEGDFTVSGYRYENVRETRTPVRLTGHTYTNAQLSALAEVGAEYNVRLSADFDLGLSVRRYFGLSNSITTDVTYTNQSSVQQTQLQGAGTGMSYGTTLRYTWHTRRKVTNALDVQGRLSKSK